MAITRFVKTFVPGSAALLLVALVIGVALLSGPVGISCWGHSWLIGLSVLYSVLSLPVASNWLTKRLSLPNASPKDFKDPAGDPIAIALLGSGSVTYRDGELEMEQLTRRSAYSVMKAARLCRRLPNTLLVASGGIVDPQTQRRPESELMRDALAGLGIPSHRILLESASRNTREQVTNTAAILRRRGIDRFVIVTVPAQMRRVMALFKAGGMQPWASGSNLSYTSQPGRLFPFLPSLTALRGSEAAIYEHLALAYYRIRGWL